MADPNLPQQESISVDFITQPVAGEANYELKMPSNVVLAQAAILQLVLRGPDHSRKTVVPSVSADGTYAYYVTTGAEIPLPGTYNCELQVQVSAGPPPTWETSLQFPLVVAAPV